MSKVFADISVSLDGFVAGPNATMEDPLGKGGEQLHGWVFETESWRAAHGRSGGESSRNSEVIAETIARAGAGIMGRKMFSGGAGPWADDPNAGGWWGDEPPFTHPIFVLTHHERESVDKGDGVTYNFVTEGVEAALERARAAAGEADIQIHGGGEAIRGVLDAGQLDEVQVHVVPVLLGDGAPLFRGLPTPEDSPLRLDRVVEDGGVTHLRYLVNR